MAARGRLCRCGRRVRRSGRAQREYRENGDPGHASSLLRDAAARRVELTRRTVRRAQNRPLSDSAAPSELACAVTATTCSLGAVTHSTMPTVAITPPAANSTVEIVAFDRA